jgi:hypothetical protein
VTFLFTFYQRNQTNEQAAHKAAGEVEDTKHTGVRPQSHPQEGRIHQSVADLLTTGLPAVGCTWSCNTKGVYHLLPLLSTNYLFRYLMELDRVISLVHTQIQELRYQDEMHVSFVKLSPKGRCNQYTDQQIFPSNCDRQRMMETHSPHMKTAVKG